MAETTDSNKTKGQTADASSEVEAGSELSAEQLDGMILSEDPSFANDLKEVSALPSDTSIDLDVVDTGQLFTEVENPWKNAIGVRKFLVMILPFLPMLWELQYRFFSKMRMFRGHFRDGLLEAGPWLLQATKSGAKASAEYAKGRVAAFKGLSGRLKLVALGLMISLAVTGTFMYRSFTHGVLPPEKELLSASLEEWAVQSYKYDAESEMDSFYDSPRTIQNIMSLPKIIVNIQPSSTSGPNPMAAMEFFLEGLSPEVIVEVKDRETEMRDLFQRTLEEMSYGELDTTEGKQQLTEKLRGELNSHLTKGKIRRVFIKELVLKP
jgi:flagellar basal body-associated protein FliL